jgi:hypothetical protein
MAFAVGGVGDLVCSERMVGQGELIHGAAIQQFEGGMPDGSGTFHLTPA